MTKGLHLNRCSLFEALIVVRCDLDTIMETIFPNSSVDRLYANRAVFNSK